MSADRLSRELLAGLPRILAKFVMVESQPGRLDSATGSLGD